MAEYLGEDVYDTHDHFCLSETNSRQDISDMHADAYDRYIIRCEAMLIRSCTNKYYKDKDNELMFLASDTVIIEEELFFIYEYEGYRFLKEPAESWKIVLDGSMSYKGTLEEAIELARPDIIATQKYVAREAWLEAEYKKYCAEEDEAYAENKWRDRPAPTGPQLF